MKVYFIKDFDDRPYGLKHRAGTNAILWETTAIRAISEKRAIPFTEIHRNEPQTETKAIPEGSTPEGQASKGKTKTKKGGSK